MCSRLNALGLWLATGIFCGALLRGFRCTGTSGLGLLLTLCFHCALAVFISVTTGVFLLCTLGFSGT